MREEARHPGGRLVESPSKKLMVAWTRLVAAVIEKRSWVRIAGESNVKTGGGGFRKTMIAYVEILKLGSLNSPKV